MKLHMLNEGGGVDPDTGEELKKPNSSWRPTSLDDLEKLVSAWRDDWEVLPGEFKHGDPCPKCQQTLKNKWRGLGAPKFLGCKNFHAFLKFGSGKPTLVPQAPSRATHSCKPEGRQDGESWGDWGKRVKNCPACEQDDDSLDDWDDLPQAAPRPSDIEAPDDKKTGPGPDWLYVARDLDAKRWNRKGDQRYGKRVKKRDQCTFGREAEKHSCDDPENEGIPSPAIAKDHHLFSTVTGAPKPEYQEYYLRKNRCPVCAGETETCPNKVSTKFGKPKPYCSDHVEQSPYPSQLLGKFGGPGLPDAPDPNKDYQSVKKKWRRTQAKHIERGDDVTHKKMGQGTVLEVDPEMADRTHRIKWVIPMAGNHPITWVDPETLDLVSQ